MGRSKIQLANVGKRASGKTTLNRELIKNIDDKILVVDVHNEYDELEQINLNEVLSFEGKKRIVLSGESIEKMCAEFYFITDNFYNGTIIIENILHYAIPPAIFYNSIVYMIMRSSRTYVSVIITLNQIGDLRFPKLIENLTHINLFETNDTTERWKDKIAPNVLALLNRTQHFNTSDTFNTIDLDMEVIYVRKKPKPQHLKNNKYIYVTFTLVNWLLLCNESGDPICSIDEAYEYCRNNFNGYFGISTYEQMKLNNIERDNL